MEYQNKVPVLSSEAVCDTAAVDMDKHNLPFTHVESGENKTSKILSGGELTCIENWHQLHDMSAFYMLPADDIQNSVDSGLYQHSSNHRPILTAIDCPQQQQNSCAHQYVAGSLLDAEQLFENTPASSRIYVFSTEMANVAADAVVCGRYSSLIEFHINHWTRSQFQNMDAGIGPLISSGCEIQNVPAEGVNDWCWFPIEGHKPLQTNNNDCDGLFMDVAQWVQQQNAHLQYQNGRGTTGTLCDTNNSSDFSSCQFSGSYQPRSLQNWVTPRLMHPTPIRVNSNSRPIHDWTNVTSMSHESLTLEQQQRREAKVAHLKKLRQLLFPSQTAANSAAVAPKNHSSLNYKNQIVNSYVSSRPWNSLNSMQHSHVGSAFTVRPSVNGVMSVDVRPSVCYQSAPSCEHVTPAKREWQQLFHQHQHIMQTKSLQQDNLVQHCQNLDQHQHQQNNFRHCSHSSYNNNHLSAAYPLESECHDPRGFKFPLYSVSTSRQNFSDNTSNGPRISERMSFHNSGRTDGGFGDDFKCTDDGGVVSRLGLPDNRQNYHQVMNWTTPGTYSLGFVAQPQSSLDVSTMSVVDSFAAPAPQVFSQLTTDLSQEVIIKRQPNQIYGEMVVVADGGMSLPVKAGARSAGNKRKKTANLTAIVEKHSESKPKKLAAFSRGLSMPTAMMQSLKSCVTTIVTSDSLTSPVHDVENIPNVSQEGIGKRILRGEGSGENETRLSSSSLPVLATTSPMKTATSHYSVTGVEAENSKTHFEVQCGDSAECCSVLESHHVVCSGIKNTGSSSLFMDSVQVRTKSSNTISYQPSSLVTPGSLLSAPVKSVVYAPNISVASLSGAGEFSVGYEKIPTKSGQEQVCSNELKISDDKLLESDLIAFQEEDKTIGNLVKTNTGSIHHVSRIALPAVEDRLCMDDGLSGLRSLSNWAQQFQNFDQLSHMKMTEVDTEMPSNIHEFNGEVNTDDGEIDKQNNSVHGQCITAPRNIFVQLDCASAEQGYGTGMEQTTLLEKSTLDPTKPTAITMPDAQKSNQQNACQTMYSVGTADGIPVTSIVMNDIYDSSQNVHPADPVMSSTAIIAAVSSPGPHRIPLMHRSLSSTTTTTESQAMR